MEAISLFYGFRTIVRKTAHFFGYLGILAMGLMATIVTIDVTGRFLFNKPLKGGIELVEELMVCVIFLMLAYVTEAERHIKVDVFIGLLERGAPRLLKAIHFAFDMLIIFILALLAWEGFSGSLYAMGSGEVTDSLRIPHYPFRFIMTAGFVVSFLALLSQRLYTCFNAKEKKHVS